MFQFSVGWDLGLLGGEEGSEILSLSILLVKSVGKSWESDAADKFESSLRALTGVTELK